MTCKKSFFKITEAALLEPLSYLHNDTATKPNHLFAYYLDHVVEDLTYYKYVTNILHIPSQGLISHSEPVYSTVAPEEYYKQAQIAYLKYINFAMLYIIKNPLVDISRIQIETKPTTMLGYRAAVEYVAFIYSLLYQHCGADGGAESRCQEYILNHLDHTGRSGILPETPVPLRLVDVFPSILSEVQISISTTEYTIKPPKYCDTFVGELV